MKIERVRVGRFGRLGDFDSGPEPLPSLVTVLGPNEAGKSTLFHFLTTALYGFHPATREGNPYVPWGEDEAGGRVRLRLDSGGCLEVERRLRSQPTGTMVIDGREEELRNRPLPWVDHVPGTVFAQVFAVTLRDLAGLDQEAWGHVQDRILGSMGATDLLPARHVADDLESEAGELWRPHRRGNQRVRALREEARALRARRRQAVERDEALRQLQADVEAARRELATAREERQRERLTVERVQTLAPVREQLRRIASLREAGGEAAAVEGLPPEPRAALAELDRKDAELALRCRELEREGEEPSATATRYDARARAFVQRSREIGAFLAVASGSGADRARAAQLAQEIVDLERRLDAVATDLLAVPRSEAPLGPILALPIARLRQCIERLREVRDEERFRAAAAGGAPPPGYGRAAWAGGGLALAVGLALAFFDVPSGARLAGAALAAAGATVLTLRALERLRARRSSGGSNPAVERARKTVAELLRDVPVRPDRLREPDAALASSFERLQELSRDHADRKHAEAEVAARIRALDREARVLAVALELDPTHEAGVIADTLDRELRRSERLHEAAGSAERELAHLERERTRLTEEREEVGARRARLMARLEALGDGDAEVGAERAREKIESLARARRLEEELQRVHPDLPELRERIARAERSADPWVVDDSDLARRRARIEELGEHIEALAGRVEAGGRDLAHGRGQETMDVVDGELEALAAEEARLVRERDRRWVLARLVREADRRFREEHQPDLIRRASSYLKHLTGGRYDRLVVDERTRGDLFQVLGPALPGPVSLTHPISTGTLEQAYLSLRLAIVDHLDQGGERLPLFVDEALVNWDRPRRARGLEVLGAVARSRQLFVFTCHEEVAGELAELGAHTLLLERRS